MAVNDGSASFHGKVVEVELTVGFPAVSNDPVEAMIAVVDVRQKARLASGHFAADAVLNMLIALRLR